MKKIPLFGALALVVILACAPFGLPSQADQPGVETIVAATMQAILPTQAQQVPPPAGTPAAPSAFSGTPLQFANLSLTVPPGLAVGGNGAQIPPASGEEVEPWGVTPGHTELTLTGYALPDRFHEPKIYAYPAQGFAALNNGAADNILRLQTLLANPNAPLADDKLPFVPFFNAGAVFTAQAKVIPFQGGLGVRMLTQYAQSFAQVNNQEMFYHFQGLTNDGQTYIIVILPASAPFLAANWDAPAPADGIPFPGYEDPNVDFEAYYQQVTARLEATPPDTFSPSLTMLDALVGSLNIVTP
ncbi:MAG: hypothetical protein ACOYYJ_02805 [Chloroflexota bacterium]